MNLRQVAGGVVVLVSLYILYANLKPYWDLYTFWGQFGVAGLVVMNGFWVINFLPMTALGAIGLLIGTYLLLKKSK